MKKENKRKLFGDFKGTGLKDWQQQVEKDLKGKSIEKLYWKTYEGFAVPPFFTKKELDDKAAGVKSFPGELPFRRGNAYNGLDSSWQMVQEISVDDALEAKARLHEARQADIHAFKLYSWQGSAKGQDFLPIISELNFQEEALHLYASYDPLILIDGINQLLHKKGIDRAQLTGTMTSLGIDTGRISIDSVLKLMEGSPSFRCLGIDLSLVDENGGSQVHQLAFALSRTVDWVCQTPADPDRILHALNFTFPTGSDFMMEIAKLRAFRMLFGFVAGKLGGKGEALSPFILAQSARWNKSRYDAHSNLLRTTTEAMSAIMGGAHALSVSAYDKLLGPETAFSARMARNIQHILKHESYLGQVMDPAGGSYYVEHLTNTLCEEAWKCFQEIEAEGGYEASLKSGKIDQLLIDVQLKKQESISKRDHVFVGINNYANVEEDLAERLQLENIGDEGPAIFERLRFQTDQWSHEQERRPTAYLFCFGDLVMRNARMRFASQMLASVGFQINTNNPEQELNVSLDELKEAKPEVVVLCAADGDYEGEMAKAVRQAAPQAQLLLAGKPAIDLPVDARIFAGMDAAAFLTELLEKILVSE